MSILHTSWFRSKRPATTRTMLAVPFHENITSWASFLTILISIIQSKFFTCFVSMRVPYKTLFFYVFIVFSSWSYWHKHYCHVINLKNLYLGFTKKLFYFLHFSQTVISDILQVLNEMNYIIDQAGVCNQGGESPIVFRLFPCGVFWGTDRLKIS